MTATLLAFLIKLPLALLVFLLVAYAGTVSRRIARIVQPLVAALDAR